MSLYTGAARSDALTLPFHKLVESTLPQHLVQPLVERMSCRPWQLRLRDPELGLSPLLLRSSSHRHSCNIQSTAVNRSTFFALRIQPLTTGG